MKIGFDLKHLPCASLLANKAYALIAAFAYNLVRFVAHLENPRKPHFAKFVRFKVLMLPAQVVKHSRLVSRGHVPFGMKMRNGQLVPHLGEQAVIEKLRQMRANGKSYGDLVDWLNANGLRSKNRGRWNRPTVYKILKRTAVKPPECGPRDPNDRPPR